MLRYYPCPRRFLRQSAGSSPSSLTSILSIGRKLLLKPDVGFEAPSGILHAKPLADPERAPLSISGWNQRGNSRNNRLVGSDLRAWHGCWTDYGQLFPYRIGEELPTKRPLCETRARMSHPDPNGAPDRRPIKVGEFWENLVRGERSVILERPWDNPPSRVTGELTALVGARVMGEHRHPALVWSNSPCWRGP